jgi:hypothetical protein
MIKDKLPRTSFSVLLIALLMLIMLLVISVACISNVPQEYVTKGGCSLLPEGFSESDLVGIWVAESVVHQSSDTLIIRDDGTYKQIINLEYQSIEYESDWQAWWFERRDNGTGYLHLDDYRICAAVSGDFEAPCDRVNDGKIPWADVCEEQWMDPGPRAREIILVVRGTPDDSDDNGLHPFVLTLFKGFESSPWSYSFMEP